MGDLKKYIEEAFNKIDPNHSWSHCHDNTVNFLLEKCKEYADFLALCPIEVFKKMEEKRNYSYPNYYQESNFPKLKDIHIFDDPDSLKKYVDGKGFRCPSCRGVSKSPYECDTRIKDKTGESCDWKSYGFFQSEYKITLKEAFLKDFTVESIFTPIAAEEKGEA